MNQCPDEDSRRVSLVELKDLKKLCRQRMNEEERKARVRAGKTLEMNSDVWVQTITMRLVGLNDLEKPCRNRMSKKEWMVS